MTPFLITPACADGSNSDDNDGDNFTCEGNFPESVPPTQSQTFAHGETITISADAADSDGSVSRVEFYADDTLLVYDVGAPYSFYWRPTSRGNHTLTARAYDDGGADTTSAPVTVRVK
jgi:hypothetical protein